MSKKKVEEKRERGKPLGTRQKIGLYNRILELLKQDHDDKGQGYTAFAVSGYLGEPYPTIQAYLADLTKEKKVKPMKIVHMTLFTITNKGIESLLPATKQ